MPEYKFKRTEISTEQEIRGMINQTRYDWLKVLIAFLFLFGCRITEALNMKRKDVWMDSEYLVAQIGVLKRRNQDGPYESMPHLIHISTNAPFVKDILLPYFNGIEDREARLFHKCRQLAWLRLKELNRQISPHVFRHDRLMKLALRGASEAELQDWAGWADSRPASNYVRVTGRLALKLADKVD